MKVTLTNYEIENFLNVIGHQESFRNNVGIKIPFNLDWALRVNIKKLTDRYSVINDARNDLNKSFLESDKVEENGVDIKKEYIEEYVSTLSQIMSQKNEFDFETVDSEVLKNPALEMLSMPERDFLNIMVKDEDKNEKETTE